MGTVNAGTPDVRLYGTGRQGTKACLFGGTIASMTAAAPMIRHRDLLLGAAAAPEGLQAAEGGLNGAGLAHDVRT